MFFRLTSPALAPGQGFTGTVVAKTPEGLQACRNAAIAGEESFGGRLDTIYFAADGKFVKPMTLDKLLHLAEKAPQWLTTTERGNVKLARAAERLQDLEVLGVSGETADGSAVTLWLADYPTPAQARAIRNLAEASNAQVDVAFLRMKKTNTHALDFGRNVDVLSLGALVKVTAATLVAPGCTGCTSLVGLAPGSYIKHTLHAYGAQAVTLSRFSYGTQASSLARQNLPTFLEQQGGQPLVVFDKEVPASILYWLHDADVLVNGTGNVVRLVSSGAAEELHGLRGPRALHFGRGSWELAPFRSNANIWLYQHASLKASSPITVTLVSGNGGPLTAEEAATIRLESPVTTVPSDVFPALAEGSRVGLTSRSWAALLTSCGIPDKRLGMQTAAAQYNKSAGSYADDLPVMFAPPRRDRATAAAGDVDAADDATGRLLAKATQAIGLRLRRAVKDGAPIAEELRTVLATLPGAYSNGWRIDLGVVPAPAMQVSSGPLANALRTLPVRLPTFREASEGYMLIQGKRFSIGKLLQQMRSPVNFSELAKPLEANLTRASVELTQAASHRKSRFTDKLGMPANALAMWIVASALLDTEGSIPAFSNDGGSMLDEEDQPSLCGSPLGVSFRDGNLVLMHINAWLGLGLDYDEDNEDNEVEIERDRLLDVAAGKQRFTSGDFHALDLPAGFATTLNRDLCLAYAYLLAVAQQVEQHPEAFAAVQAGTPPLQAIAKVVANSVSDLFEDWKRYREDLENFNSVFALWEEDIERYRDVLQQAQVDYQAYRRDTTEEYEAWEKEYAEWEEEHRQWEEDHAAWSTAYDEWEAAADSSLPEPEEPDEPEEPEPAGVDSLDDILDFDDWARDYSAYSEDDLLEPVAPEQPAHVPDPWSTGFTGEALMRRLNNSISSALVGKRYAQVAGLPFTYVPLGESAFAEAEVELRRIQELNKPLHLYVSCHPKDILAQSTGRVWQSCKAIDGMNAHYLAGDLANGVMVAYVASAEDRDLERPFGRVLISPYSHDKPEGTLRDMHVTWRASSQVYGEKSLAVGVPLANFLADFSAAANELLGVMPAKEDDGDAPLVDGLYADGEADKARPEHDRDASDNKTIVGSLDYALGKEQWKADMTGRVVCPLLVKNLPGKLGTTYPAWGEGTGPRPRLDFGRVAAFDSVEFDDWPLDPYDSVSRGRGTTRLMTLSASQTSEKLLENCNMTVWLDEQAWDGVARLALSRSKLVFQGYAGFSALELNGNNSAVVVKAGLGALSLFGVDAVYDPEEPEATPSAATQFALRDSRLIVKGDTPYVLASCDEYSAKWLQGVFYTPYGLPGKVQRVLEANPNVKFVNGLPEKLAAVYYPARNA